MKNYCAHTLSHESRTISLFQQTDHRAHGAASLCGPLLAGLGPRLAAQCIFASVKTGFTVSLTCASSPACHKAVHACPPASVILHHEADASAEAGFWLVLLIILLLRLWEGDVLVQCGFGGRPYVDFKCICGGLRVSSIALSGSDRGQEPFPTFAGSPRASMAFGPLGKVWSHVWCGSLGFGRLPR